MQQYKPTDRVPADLSPVGYSPYTPALSVYGHTSLAIDTTTVTVNSEVFTFTGKTLPRLAAEISRALPTVEANSHLDLVPVSDSLFNVSSDQTPDGGTIIRYLGFAVRQTERSRIRLTTPTSPGPIGAWWPRINTGTFATTFNGNRYQYSIPEYHTQEWSIRFGKPYIEHGNVPVEIITRRILQVPRGPILSVAGSISLVRNDQQLTDSVIRDVDEQNRLIYLKNNIDPNDRIFITYVYKEDNYTYRGINLNPSLDHSPYLIDQFVLIYIKPHRTSNGTLNNSVVNHVVANTLDGAIGLLPRGNDPIVILGALRPRHVDESSDILVTDARRRGGGLKEDVDKTSVQPESTFFTDIGYFDGKPYPGNAVIIANVPNSVLTLFTAEEIYNIARKHMAFGSVPIIEYY